MKYGKECGNCRFSSLQLNEEYWFECRINPPVGSLKESDRFLSVWPIVHKYDWCGKHEDEAE